MQSLTPLKGDVAWYAKTVLTRARRGDGLPPKLEIQDEIGRGSNNRVFRAIFDGEHLVTVRRPRRKSDTERVGYATCEFRHTLLASRLGVAPILYDAWYVRHAKTDQRAGLHMIQQYYPYDLMDAFSKIPEEVGSHCDEIGAAIDKNIKLMADANMLCYDLKPGNIVISFEETPDVKFIDFGREFCEHHSEKNEVRTCVSDSIRVAARAYAKKHSQNAEEIHKYLLYCTMTIILAATTTDAVYKNRATLRADRDTRRTFQCMRKYANAILDDTRGDIIKLLKDILRIDEVRELLRHYVGRRNSGTRRIFRLARGFEN